MKCPANEAENSVIFIKVSSFQRVLLKGFHYIGIVIFFLYVRGWNHTHFFLSVSKFSQATTSLLFKTVCTMPLCGHRYVEGGCGSCFFTFTFNLLQLLKLPNESIQHPTPLIKLIITWSKIPRYHKYLVIHIIFSLKIFLFLDIATFYVEQSLKIC